MGLEWLWDFFYFSWIASWCALPVGLVIVVNGTVHAVGALGAVGVLVPWVLAFPIVLLSSLGSNSWSGLLHGRILLALLTKPHALVILYVTSLGIVLPCLWLTLYAIDQFHFGLIVAAGFVSSAC